MCGKVPSGPDQQCFPLLLVSYISVLLSLLFLLSPFSSLSFLFFPFLFFPPFLLVFRKLSSIPIIKSLETIPTWFCKW